MTTIFERAELPYAHEQTAHNRRAQGASPDRISLEIGTLADSLHAPSWNLFVELVIGHAHNLGSLTTKNSLPIRFEYLGFRN